jgi:hypothetical protein
MGVADAVMGATKPGLEVPEDTMDARQNLGRPARVALRVRSVPVTLLREGVVASPAVSDHDRSRSHVRSHEAGQRPGRDVRNHFEAYPSGSLAPDLYRAHNDRLVNNVAPATQARFWPADVGFIYLDRPLRGSRSGRTMARRSFCSMAQAVSYRRSPNCRWSCRAEKPGV